MKEKIIELIKDLPEKEQNSIITEVRQFITCSRQSKVKELEAEVSRIKETMINI